MFFVGLVFVCLWSSRTNAQGASRCPAYPAFPDANCTGVLPGVARSTTGGFSTSSQGQVIQNLDVNGSIQVVHNNVTIRNVRFRSGGQAITLNPSNSGLVVEDCEIDGTGATDGASAIGDLNYTIRRCNIHHIGEGPRSNGNVLIEDNYLHDFINFIAQGAHQDCFQITSGANTVIRHNRCLMNVDGGNAAIQTGSFEGSNLLFENNLLGGGGYTVYCGQGLYSNVTVRDNHISTAIWPNGGYYGPFVNCGNATMSGNRWHDGPKAGQFIGPAGSTSTPPAPPTNVRITS